MKSHWERSAKWTGASGTVAYWATRGSIPHKAVVTAHQEGRVKIAVTWFPDATRSTRWTTPDRLEPWTPHHVEIHDNARQAVTEKRERAHA